MRIVLDIESNGLLNDPDESKNATKIHCLCWYDIDEGDSGSTTDYSIMIKFLTVYNLTIIGHKITTYDIPLLEKILGIKVVARLIDTLGLSWYLFPKRNIHGLDAWAEDLGLVKPPIDNWSGDTEEGLTKILHRCQEDVKINTKLFHVCLALLMKIYDGNLLNIGRIMDYISFKLDCAREQEEVKFRLDIELCRKNLEFLVSEKQKKIDILTEIMPPSYKYKVKSKPKEMFKKDGSISSHGQKWLDLLKEHDLPEYHNGALKLVDKTLKGNPNSHTQLKEWLFSLGWKPDEFDYQREIKGDYKSPVRAIPQIGSKEKPGELSQSVKDLIEKVPELEELDSYFVLQHRIGILESFLEHVDKNGFVMAQISGLTNTLRFQHSKPIVNLPTTPKKYWEMVRGCLVTPDDKHTLCGWDMSGLESTTQDHYMAFFDPKYVEEKRVPTFDPHLDIAVLSGAMTKDEAEFYKYYDKTKN